MILMDYHIVFIVISFVLLLYVFELVFFEDRARSVIAAMIICGLNSTLCVIIYLSFFGIGIIGYNISGEVDVTTYTDMYPLFMFFFGMYWINVILIFYCWYRYTYTVWTDKEK
jgi:hypothetical protein